MKKLFLFLITILFFSCNDRFCKDSGIMQYDFYFPITISLASDNYKIGDTAWIEGIATNPMYDFRHGGTHTVVLSNNYFMTVSGIDITTNYTGTMFKFLPVESYGGIYREDVPGRMCSVNVIKTDNGYKFKFGIVMLREGIYALMGYKSGTPASSIGRCNVELISFTTQNKSFLESSYTLLSNPQVLDKYKKLTKDEAKKYWIFKVVSK